MSVNAMELTNVQLATQTHNSELIYRLEDRPPLVQTLLAACQYLLAMFVAVITPVLLIRQALDLPAQDTQHTISMLLFASGVASIIQIKAWGPVGSGLLPIQGTSFNLVAPLIMGGTALEAGGVDVPTMMAVLFGMSMLASCTKMVISRVLHLARRIIAPLASGVVMMTVGLSLIQVSLTSIGGGYTVMNDSTSGALKNLLLAGVVPALATLPNRQRNPYLRVALLMIAMVIGYLLAWFMNMLPQNTTPVSQDLLMVPTSPYYGLSTDWSLLLPLMLVFMITSLGTIDDITATFGVSGQLASDPLYTKRLKDGVPTNGPDSFVSAVFSTFSNSCLGQNNGVIQPTSVASRYIGFVVALMLIALGLFPAVNGFVQHIPEPVLGSATLAMFGTIAVFGIRIVSHEPLGRRAVLIIAPSLAIGLGVSQQPLILQFTPDWMKNLLSSGIAAGGTTVTVLNLVFSPEKQ